MRKESNFEKAAEYVRAAARQHAHLAVLPEYHLLNWLPDDEKFKEACGDWEVYVNKYRDLAKECNICIVPGTIVELHDAGTENERLLNVAYFIDNTGEILGKYVKKNLWGPIERNHLTSSTHDPHEVFDTPVGKVGILICWDLAFNEAFRELISQGAKMIIIPTFWTLSDVSTRTNFPNIGQFVDSFSLRPIVLERRASNQPNGRSLVLRLDITCSMLREHMWSVRPKPLPSPLTRNAAVVFANAGGPAGKGYAGLSQICMPWSGAIARLGSHAEGMAVADVEMNVLEAAERNYQVRADLARSDWHYMYRHDKEDAKL